jgi:hypothetical protein
MARRTALVLVGAALVGALSAGAAPTGITSAAGTADEVTLPVIGGLPHCC